MDDNHNHGGNNQPTTSETTVTTTTTQSGASPKEPATDFTFNEQTIMAALSYVGPLVLVPFLTKKEDSFIQFHVKQGMLVFGIYLVIWVLGGWLFFLYPIYPILNLVALVLSIIGIINAVKRTEKELPIIGKYASHIKI